MTTLITGGTGKTGRRVAQRLTATGRTVKLGSRSGDVRFDWDDELTWAPALDGCASAYITFAPDLAFPGAADTVAAFAKTALDAGTTRLVLLSGRGEPGAQLAEQRLMESGADWTVVRCAFFAQNFSETFWADSVRAGELALPGNALEPIVDLEDVADVAAAALTDDRHLGEVYECTGPRLLGFDEAMAEISRATGRTGRVPRGDSRGLRCRTRRRRTARCRRGRAGGTCSSTSSTATTARWPTAYTAPSAASRATSPSTCAVPLRREPGMSDYVLLTAKTLAGLLAGVFFAYATSMMPALRAMDDDTFLTVMNKINVVIVNPVFLVVFLGAPSPPSRCWPGSATLGRSPGPFSRW